MGRSTGRSMAGPPNSEISIAITLDSWVAPDRSSLEGGGETRRRQQLFELFPAPRFTRRGAGAGFDEAPHEILAQVVVDHVAAILIEEAHPLLGAILRHQRESLEPGRRGSAVDLAIQIPSRCLVAGISQPIDQPLHAVVLAGLARVETGRGKHDRLLEGDSR